MKYYVIKSVNGIVSIVSEWTDADKAKVDYHDACKTLWNAPDVIDGCVAIIDSQLYVVEDYKEYISHPEKEIKGENAV